MTITPEEIMAYVDGELDDATRSRITLAALADLDLADKIAAERRLRDRLQAHFAPVGLAPVPTDWVQTINTAAQAPEANVIDLAAARARNSDVSGISRWWSHPAVGAAIAASLVLGVFVGANWQGLGTNGPITATGGGFVASGNLAKALDSQLASAQDGAPIRMLGTFRSNGGEICRVFTGQQVSGIACHESDTWKMQHLLPGNAGPSSAYRQAGSHDGQLLAIAQDMAAGEPLDAEQERITKNHGWR